MREGERESTLASRVSGSVTGGLTRGVVIPVPPGDSDRRNSCGRTETTATSGGQIDPAISSAMTAMAANCRIERQSRSTRTARCCGSLPTLGAT
jgi:hypothetical protein